MAIALFAGAARAQSVMLDPGRMTWFRVPEPIEQDDIVLKMRKAYGGRSYTYVELGLENWRKDPLLFYRHEPVFVFPYTSLSPYDGLNEKRPLVVPPRDSRFVELGVEGSDGLNATGFEIDWNGFYVATGPVQPIPAPDMRVDAENSTFHAGPLHCWRGKLKQLGRELEVVFRCRYSGAGVGFVDGREVRLVQEGHRPMKNQEKKDLYTAARDGEVLRFTMYFELPKDAVDLEAHPATLEWHDTYSERGLAPLSLPTVQLEIDPVATQTANP